MSLFKHISQLSEDSWENCYPLTPAEVIPSINCFCIIRYSVNIGTTEYNSTWRGNYRCKVHCSEGSTIATSKNEKPIKSLVLDMWLTISSMMKKKIYRRRYFKKQETEN